MLAVLLGTAACSGPSSPDEFYPIDGYVHGVVRDEAGAAQAGADVEVEFFPFRCPEGPASSTTERGTTTDSGSYHLLVRGPHYGELAVCLTVRAQTEQGLSGSVKGVLLILRAALHSKPDSVRVDVTVR